MDIQYVPIKQSYTAFTLRGVVEAGFPSPAEEELSDTMTLDEYLIAKPEATVLLPVQTEAMTGAGILAGDVVLVERGRKPKDGDVVVAEVDGAVMLRRYRIAGKQVWLEAAHPAYPPTHPQEQLVVVAVAVATIRKY